MPVWTVSQRFSHLQWRRLFKELWARPTTIADFGLSLSRVPHTSDICLLEDKVQDRGMYLFTISYGSNAMDPNFEVLDARIASALNKIIQNSQFRRRISLEEQKAQNEDRFFRGGQIAYLIYDQFRVTGTHESVENYTDLFIYCSSN